MLRQAVVPKQKKVEKAGMMRSDSHRDEHRLDRTTHNAAEESEPVHPREILFPGRYGPSSQAESNPNAVNGQSAQDPEAQLIGQPQQLQQSQQDDSSNGKLEHLTIYGLVEASTVASSSPPSVWSAIGTPVHRAFPSTVQANDFRLLALDLSGFESMPPFCRIPQPRLFREFRVFGPRGWQYLWDATITQAVHKTDEYLQDIFEPCEPRVLLAKFLDVPYVPGRSVLQWYWSRKLHFEPNTPRPPVPEDLRMWWEQVGFVGHMDSWPTQLERILQNERDGRSFQDRTPSFSSPRI